MPIVPEFFCPARDAGADGTWRQRSRLIEVIGMNRIVKAAPLLVALVLTACESPKPAGDEKTDAKRASAAGEPLSGKTSYWELYKSAHSWASDQVPLKLESQTVPGSKNEAGKAVVWNATFGSPSRHEARVFTYSVVERAPDIHKGVTIGHSLPWPGPTRDAMTFDSSDFVIDSDAAYQTAWALASTWAKTHPDKEVSLTLGNAARFPAPVWYVLWGDTKSGYAVFVNAKSGAVINQK